ncbi:MAG TPA: hypothetical protein DCS93_36605 [Microscillaceae bacterium]|nr:hypothetical protein [Microscillaceae bacterium]
MSVKTPDFDTLRQNGLELIQKLATTTWTDHNDVDPGITLLEQICYALTDLGYRVDFDIVDLLAGGSDEAYRLLYSPREALSTQPVVFDDHRRTLIDSNEVTNAYLSKTQNPAPQLYYAPFSEELLLQEHRNELLSEDTYRLVQLKGLLDVEVQKAPDASTNDVAQQVKQKLHAQRNMATDIENIHILPEEKIKIQVELELGFTKDVEALAAQVMYILYQYTNPHFSFEKLLDFQQNQSVEETFDGPSMLRGFLTKAALTQFQKRAELRRSDLVQALMNLTPEVKTIRSLDIAREGEAFSRSILDWLISLDADKAVVFDLDASNILFFTDDLPVSYDLTMAKARYNTLLEQNRPHPLASTELDYAPPQGRNREVTQYTSVRQHMPEVYGITPYGLPEKASNVRRAQAKQLSAYLLFFEQILADFFAQLGSLPTLFSVNRNETDYQTYFAQTLSENQVPALEGIYQSPVEDITKSESFFGLANDKNRNTRLLDHFMARFGEQFSDNILGQTPTNVNTFGDAIAAKRNFLQEYPTLSAGRGVAFDYTNLHWNVSGTQKRIARLLGLRVQDKQNLAFGAGIEGFYLVEHILLRPRSGDRFQNGLLMSFLKTDDPYSLQVSYVFHKVGRFTDEGIRRFTERLLRAETPSHIQIKTYWLDIAQMATFEKAQDAFLQELNQLTSSMADTDHQYSLRVARDYLLDLLYMYHSAYPNPYNLGVPLPMRDLPIPRLAPKYETNSAQQQDGKWVVQIQVYYPQVNVTYRLCDRDRQPIASVPPLKITADTILKTDPQANNQPYEFIASPPIDQDQLYWIRAEKEVTAIDPQNNNEITKSLKYVFLAQPIRVRVGLSLVIARGVPDEIDFGTQADIELSEIQANVEYRLYADLNNNGTLERIDAGGSYSGVENGSITIPTNVTNGFTEDVLIIVRGSRDGFSTEIDVSSFLLKVRAYTGLILTASQSIVDYGVTTGVNVTVSNGALPTQKSVDYHLFYRPISDPEFVHHKLTPPPANELVTMDNGLGANVSVLKPAVPTTADNTPQAYNAAPIEPINYQLVSTLSPANDGDNLVFDISALNLPEDTLFMVVASKNGHTAPRILNDGSSSTIAVILTKPDPSPTFVIDPSPVVSGTIAKITVQNPQNGVKYYLEYESNKKKQVAKIFHDRTTSPRKDGVGYSKIEVDFATGEAIGTNSLTVETRNPITTAKVMNLIAEKPQTGIELQIAQFTFNVS